MGCDIHTMAEIGFESSSKTRELYWSEVTSPIFSYGYYRPEEPIGLWNFPYTHLPYQGRNYRLFSKLADVRNGGRLLSSLFGGVERDRIEPLAQPRGVPDDASEKWHSYARDVDLHSHTWFTLEELYAFKDAGKFSDTITERGWVPLKTYIEFRVSGTRPQAWSGGVGGIAVQKITEEEAAAMSVEELQLLKAESTPASKGIYVAMSWEDTVGEETYGQFFKTMDEMKERLVNERTPMSMVRIMIAFDN